MLVLIDESGDPGFKLARGSTRHFVVAMVIFHDYAEAERTSTAISEARKLLRAKPEFKFNKCADVVRDGFFKAVSPFEFRVRALVADKVNIYSAHLRSETAEFYRYFMKLLMHRDASTLAGARIKIDGSGDREFKRELGNYLRRQLGSGKIKSLKFADSRNDNLVQLADMVAGAIARSYRTDDRRDHGRWRGMLRQKIEDVWDFR